MIGALDFLREFTYPSIFLRLALAMLFGGIIGLEGTRKGRAAGFRTYILVSVGSALTILLGQYMAQMLELSWNSEEGARVDTARMGAQVINGIGFLGAGTILVTNRQQVKGLTTAAGLWASACVGLAIGAGFYECVIPAFLLVFAVVKLLPYGEDLIIQNLRNINLYVEYDKLEHTGKVVDQIRKLGVQIYEIEIDRQGIQEGKRPSAVFTLRLKQKIPHVQVVAHISALECISSIEEI
mgnify:FL=1